MDHCRDIWNAGFEKIRESGENCGADPRLPEWLHAVPDGKPRRALDVGCGFGLNAKLLLDNGFVVCAIDFSDPALELCRINAPKAHRILADFRDGLPFAGGTFELVVADLSLHYFAMAVTASVIRDIADGPVMDGLFAGRFNATNGIHYGAHIGVAVDGDDSLFLVDGIQKRFFSRDCFDALLERQWRIASLEEKSTQRFGAQKIFWELVCAKGEQVPPVGLHYSDTLWTAEAFPW